MQLRLVYERAKNGTVERLNLPLLNKAEISLKANILSVICEEQGVTHNFRCEKYNGSLDCWEEWFIPQEELMKIL